MHLYLPSIVCLALGVAGLPLEPDEDSPVSYDGYKAFRVKMDSSLQDIQEKLGALSYDQWNFNPREYLDISLPGNQVADFESLGLNYKVMHEDLGQSIREESLGMEDAEGTLSARQADWYDSYHPYADHVKYFNQLSATFPTNSEIISQGTSLQGRNMYGMKLFGSDSDTEKEAIIFHGNVHAREWITSMTLEYITNELLTGFNSGDSDVQTILDKYDMYIFPFVNPDGFVYSQTQRRLWRKNRARGPLGLLCYGVDINRNWPYKWDVTNDQGSSGFPCDETYRGRSPGDQPETKSMTSFVDKIAAKQPIKLYVDFHSYGQYILSPYGYTCSKLPPNNAKHLSLGNDMADSIASVYGTQFTVGPSCQTLYATDGSSTDYVGEVGGSELSYAFELRDMGENGFVLPPDQIRPTGVEMWEGVRTLLLEM